MRIGVIPLRTESWVVLFGLIALTAAACSSGEAEPEAVTETPVEPQAAEPAEGDTPDAADGETAGALEDDQQAVADEEDGGSDAADPPPPGGPALPDGSQVPPAPSVPDGPLHAALSEDLDFVFARILEDPNVPEEEAALARIGASGDARVAWLLSDLLRFFQRGPFADAIVRAFEQLTSTDVTGDFAWPIVTNWLIAWDTPAPPGYVAWKRILFEEIEPAWTPFFDDADADIDWRWVSWGGVFIDDRPVGHIDAPCRRCIPALDDPAVTDAAGGDWYDDHRIVFGVVVNGDARAYPKHMMEVHEMVNDTLGGRRIGISYCTLCGSAQAYFTDRPPEGFRTLELRTSGLLSRSNKVMFDLQTFSVFDTFRGVAVSGPLQDEGVVLEMVSVVTSTWGDWKAAHPDTTIIAPDGGIGRVYALDPLRGRDDAGPIFPVGAVDPRLPVQELVLGIELPDGTTLAFPVEQARRALEGGVDVQLDGVRLTADGGGVRAELEDGTPIASHEAFWFAWSQFHPDTALWTPSPCADFEQEAIEMYRTLGTGDGRAL